MTGSRLFTASYRPALLGKVKSWHATVFESGHIEQLVEMVDQAVDSGEPMMVRRAYYSDRGREIAERLRKAVSSEIFHQLEDQYETPQGILHYREVNSGQAASGRHRVSTRGACALAQAGEPDMIIFMGIWEKIRAVLPLSVEEPRSDFSLGRL